MSNIPDYEPPPPDLQKRASARIVRPDHVGGMLGRAEVQPDRLFLVLEPRKDGPDRVWEVDGFCVKDQVNNRVHWKLHFLCPICESGLTLDSTKKAMEIHDGRGLEVEEFRCAWKGDFGSRLCEFRAAIRLPKAKDEAIVRCDHDPLNPRRIDGVFVRT